MATLQKKTIPIPKKPSAKHSRNGYSFSYNLHINKGSFSGYRRTSFVYVLLKADIFFHFIYP